MSTTSVMTTQGIEDVFIATDQIDGNVLEHFVCECIGDEAYCTWKITINGHLLLVYMFVVQSFIRY